MVSYVNGGNEMVQKFIVLSVFAAFLFVQGCDAKAAKKQSPEQPAGNGISWVYDLDQGFAAAKQSGKPIMMDVFAEWCGWCKKLDSEVYTDKNIVTLSQKFVNVKLDSDKNQEVAKKYGVRGLPTIIFLSPDGKVINKVVGFHDSGAFAADMNKALGK
jgi:thiol:disulfide interchange protein